MTKVTFYKKSGIYYGFTETGHAGLGEMGGVDELCAVGYHEYLHKFIQSA